MNLTKFIIIVSIVLFLSAGTTGMEFFGAVMGHGDMGMITCPLMSGSSAVCNMNPLEHLSAWQNLFAAIPAQGIILILLALLVVVSLFHLEETLWLSYQSPQRFYIARNPDVSLHDSLRRFIVRGLLHPKTF